MTAVGGWPDCELVQPAEVSREQWLAARAGGLGGSDLVIILGHGYKSGRTEHQLWLEKTGQLTPTESGGNLRMRRGNHMEAFIGEEFVRDQRPDDPGLAIDRMGLVRSLAHPELLGSADFRVRWSGGVTGGLECKHVDNYQTARLLREISHISQYPRFYWQGVDYLAVTGAQRWSWAVDSPYYDELVIHHVERTDVEADIARVIEVGTTWWTRHVVLGLEVDPVEQAELTELLDDTVEAEQPWQVQQDLDRLRELRYPGTKEGKAEKAEVLARLEQAIGDHKVLTLLDEPVVRWQTSQGRGTLDTELLDQLYPGARAACTKPGTPSRTLRLVR